MMRVSFPTSWNVIVLVGLWTACFAGQTAAGDDALDRLTAHRLEEVHQSLLSLKSQRQDLMRPGPLREYRANLHVHSGLSHDSRGTIDEIVAAAKTVGTAVLMFTEHP